MNHSDARSVRWQTFSIAAALVATLGTSPRGASAQVAAGQGQTATNPTRYQVNYRASESDPWQLYASTRSLEKANTIAAEVKSSGYLSEVVNNLTPAPQPYPDYAETSASRYYPTSNWSSDYNYYMLPGGNYNYGWYGGWYPSYGYRSYPNYWWNGGRSYYGAGWGGHYWGGGWRRGGGWGGAGWSGGAWSGNHRNWNNSHVDRGTHSASHERHSDHAHHQNHAQQHSAGHHAPGHHAAARHASHASGEHRGTGHRGAGATTPAGVRVREPAATAAARTAPAGMPGAAGAQPVMADHRGATPQGITRVITIPESSNSTVTEFLQQARR